MSYSDNTLKVIPLLNQYFHQDPIPVEKSAYEALLKKNIEYDGTYIAAPWAVCINSQKLNEIPNIKTKNGVTICQHIWYRNIIPILEKMGISILFASSASTNETYNNLTVIPYPLYPVNGIGPSPTKDIYYSFIGFLKTHPIREEIIKIKHPQNCVVIARNDYYFSHKSNREKNEYQNVLSRSRFSLCPRGTGPNSVRFWESLQAGAIPVLISDDLLLPPVVNWNECIIQVAESEVGNIPSILKKISQEKEISMRKNCYEVFKYFFNDPSIYIQTMLNTLKKGN